MPLVAVTLGEGEVAYSEHDAVQLPGGSPFAKGQPQHSVSYICHHGWQLHFPRGAWASRIHFRALCWLVFVRVR